jgi:hypothetical protein
MSRQREESLMRERIRAERLSERNDALEARIRELELPWWKRLFGMKPKGLMELQENRTTASN